MKDYRWPKRTAGKHPVEQLIEQAKEDGRDPSKFEEGYVRQGLPPDRKGLIAAFHAQCMIDEKHVEQINNMAKTLAKRTKQRVYIVMTESRWHLLLFALDNGNYDGGEDNDRYANDQFIGYYDAKGSWHFVGCS